jgi:hypothetical protein
MNLPSKWTRSSFTATFFLGCIFMAGCAFLFVEKDVPSDTLDQIREDSAPYQKKGSGSISGVVKIDTASATFVAGDGTSVLLTPATRYALGRFQEYVVAKNELPEQRAAELVWFTHTDAAGRFRFQGLPPGDYLLASPLTWSPSGSGADARQEITYARLQLGSGEAAEVTLTRAVNP